MDYATMLKKAISKSGYSLTQICFKLAKREIWLDKGIISKMQNGKFPPAKDEVNIILADILNIDSASFRVAAVKEIIPESLFNLIRKTG